MEFTKEQKLFHTIVQKAWEDTAFKQELMTNPLEAIENLTGKRLKLPEGKTDVVNDQTEESVIYINIPLQQIMDDVELTEEQLEIIAGGGDPSKPAIQNAINNPNPLGDIEVN